MSKIKKIKLPNDLILDIVDAGAVRFNESQSLTTSQQSVARVNIGAGTVSTKDATPSSSPIPINADTLGGHTPDYYATDGDLSSLSIDVSTLQTTKADVTNGTVISHNADFAEIGEWNDGNPDDENRIGYFVTLTKSINGFIIDKATSTSDVCGVIVASPAFSGNANDKYNSDKTLKKQYDYVALLGLASVIDNGNCTVPGRCMPASDGTAVPSTNNMGFNVISRIDSTHIEVFMRPGADMLKHIKDDITTLQTNKVDKIAGKGLSTNDYTTTEKNKLSSIEDNATAVTESTVSNWGFTKNTGTYSKPSDGIPKSDLVSAVQTSLNKADTALQSHQSLSAYRTAEEQDAIHDSTKQDTISDLSTIRTGAGLGATAVQPEAGKGLFSGSYNDLTNKPTIPAAQVNADWNAASGVAQILNKPVIPAAPTVVSVSLPTASWIGSASPYTQTVSVTGATANSKIDLQPDSTVIARMLTDGTSALYIENNNGTLTAYAIGTKPGANLTVQATRTEVTA